MRQKDGIHAVSPRPVTVSKLQTLFQLLLQCKQNRVVV